MKNDGKDNLLETHINFDVLVSGLNVVDLLVSMPTDYRTGYKHEVEQILIQGGAPAGNAACGMAGLGLRTGFLGYLGDNIPSRIAEHEFHRCGVDTSLMLYSAPAVPATALVEVTAENGERTVFYTKKGYFALQRSDIRSEWLDRTRLILVDGYDIEGNLALLEMAEEKSIPSVVDIEAGERDTLLQMLRLGSHVILPLETAQFISEKGRPEDCLDVLGTMSNGTLIVTDGANGSWGKRENSAGESTLCFQPSFSVPVVDTTGCGDAYHAAYAYVLLQGYGLLARMEFASAFAAIVAQHFGGRSYFPQPEEVLSLIQKS